MMPACSSLPSPLPPGQPSLLGLNREFIRWLGTTACAGPIIQHHEYDHGEGAPMIVRMQKDLTVHRVWLSACVSTIQV